MVVRIDIWRLKIMSKYYSISGRAEIYDFEKFRDWLFEELQKQDFVGTFDINIDETSKCTCEKWKMFSMEGKSI